MDFLGRSWAKGGRGPAPPVEEREFERRIGIGRVFLEWERGNGSRGSRFEDRRLE
jgi:hypothetical protein